MIVAIFKCRSKLPTGNKYLISKFCKNIDLCVVTLLCCCCGHLFVTLTAVVVLPCFCCSFCGGGCVGGEVFDIVIFVAMIVFVNGG